MLDPPPGKEPDALLVCYGATVYTALDAARELSAQGHILCVINARFAKPLDAGMIVRVLSSGKPVLTIEDHTIRGGFGSAFLELASERGLDTSKVRLLGMPDRFIAHASRQQQLAETGLDAAGIVAETLDMIHAGASTVQHLRKIGESSRRNTL
jgi:1-deoxy-D-xylulose-5-phosphate synthase